METDQATVAVYRQEQRRDVAVTNEDFGVATNQLVVELGEESHTAVAAPEAPDAGDLGIGKKTVKVPQSVAVPACEVALALVDVLAKNALKAQLA